MSRKSRVATPKNVARIECREWSIHENVARIKCREGLEIYKWEENNKGDFVFNWLLFYWSEIQK